MKLIFKYLKPVRTKAILTAVMYGIIALVSLFMPYIVKHIVDNGIRNKDLAYILTQGGMMLGIALIGMASALFVMRLKAYMSAEFMYRMRKDIFNKVNSLSFEAFANKGTSALLSRTTEDVWMLQEASVEIIYFMVSAPLLFIGGIVMTMIENATLGIILLAVSPVIVGIVYLIGRQMFNLWNEAEKSMDTQNRVMRERLSGLRVIRSFDKEEHEHDRVADATVDMSKNIIRSNVLSGLIDPVQQVALNIVTVLILYVGASKISEGALLSAGSIIASVQYIGIVMAGLMSISFTFVFMPSTLVAAKRIQEVFDLQGVQMGESEGKLTGDLRFEHVDFAYPDSSTNSLTDICMDIAQGDVVGLIGGTGSGKSTIIKLIMDFYSPTSGKILLGGKEQSGLAKATVRDNVSVALQKAMIFQGTIDYNIRIGREDATAEEVDKVCSIAQMQELLDSKDKGLLHPLQQAGSDISGGQKQRISIARSIIKDASVYIFDDSFSALDYLTESKLRKALNVYLDGKTQIVVTQRAATAMRCDKIYVMDKGRIVGHGKHRDLLKNCAIYKEIYDSQLGGQGNE